MSKTITFEIAENHIPEVLADFEKAVYEALEVCGGTIETYAQDLCPVGTEESTGIKGYKGGSLRSTIRHEFENDRSVAIKAGGIDGIYRYVNYAVYVEMGTIKMNAQPYLKPAIENHIDEYRKIIERALESM